MIAVYEIEHRLGEFCLRIDALEVPTGTYTVVLGASGAGKTVLLKVVTGLIRPQRGRVEVDGRGVTDLPVEKRSIGLVFQEPSLFPHLTVAQNIAYGLVVTGRPKAERKARVAELVELLNLGPILDRPSRTLSGGEAQKVVLARALAVEPKVLLLDEPLSQVDHNARAELQQVLRRLHRELSLTCLHVTHNREEALGLGQRCAVMLGGRVIQQGPLEALRARPFCALVARFVDCDPHRQPTRPAGCAESCLTLGHCDCQV